jgi:hypothetical protein
MREDILLRKLVSEIGENNWARIAAEMRNRNPRQCRERWFNYLSPNIRNVPWTDVEDALLVNKVKEYGQSWHRIAQFFPMRTDINIKNRYHVISKKRHHPSSQPVQADVQLAPFTEPTGQQIKKRIVASGENPGLPNVRPPSGASPFSLASLLNA